MGKQQDEPQAAATGAPLGDTDTPTSTADSGGQPWRRFLTPLRYVVSGGLLVYLISQAHPLEIWRAWQQLDLRLLLLAFALQLIGITVSAAKWHVLLRARGHRLPFRWMLGTYLVGQFANNFLPTTIGGDALRAMQLGRRIGSYSQSSASIFVERLTGFLALSLLVNLALSISFLWETGTPLVTEPLWHWLTIGFSLAAVGTAIFSFVAPLIQTRFKRLVPLAAHGPLEKITTALRDYFPQGGTLAGVMAMSVLFQSIWIGVHVAAGWALGIDAPLLLYAIMVPMTDILGLLPIFVNNLGVREAVFTIYLTQIPAVTTSTALALAFLIFSIRLVVSLLGGLVLLWGGARLPHTNAPDTPPSGPVSSES